MRKDLLIAIGLLAALFVGSVLLLPKLAENVLLETAAKWNRVGKSADQWLEQYSSPTREWDKVALIFGYDEDYELCSQIVAAIEQSEGEKFPDAMKRVRFRCIPAN